MPHHRYPATVHGSPSTDGDDDLYISSHPGGHPASRNGCGIRGMFFGAARQTTRRCLLRRCGQRDDWVGVGGVGGGGGGGGGDVLVVEPSVCLPLLVVLFALLFMLLPMPVVKAFLLPGEGERVVGREGGRA